MTYISNKNYDIEVALGNVNGVTAKNKFGRNITIAATTQEDMWTPGGSIAYQTSAATVDIVAGANDVLTTGTGAWEVTLQGLDGSYLEVEETISLNGAATVTTTQTFLRLTRAFIGRVGSGGTNSGDIDMTWTGGAVVANQILAGAGQTEYLSFTVPANYKAIGRDLTFGIIDDASSGTRSVEIYIYIRLYNAASTNNYDGWRRIHTVFLNQSGTTDTQAEIFSGSIFPEKTDLRCVAYSTKADTSAFGRITYHLHDV